MDEQSKAFLAKIDAWQKQNGVTDAQLCRLLKMSPATLSLTRSGARSVGLKLLEGLLSKVPALKSDVIAFMKARGKAPFYSPTIAR